MTTLFHYLLHFLYSVNQIDIISFELFATIVKDETIFVGFSKIVFFQCKDNMNIVTFWGALKLKLGSIGFRSQRRISSMVSQGFARIFHGQSPVQISAKSSLYSRDNSNATRNAYE